MLDLHNSHTYAYIFSALLDAQIDRLVELFLAYSERVHACEAGLERTRRDLTKEGLSPDEVEVPWPCSRAVCLSLGCCSFWSPIAEYACMCWLQAQLQDEVTSRRMEAGLYSLQMVAYIIAEAITGSLLQSVSFFCFCATSSRPN